MENIKNILLNKEDMISSGAADEKQIFDAEDKLGVKFNMEYSEYLQAFGTVLYDGHELTGISKSKRLDVVGVTLENRENMPEKFKTLYVIEETNYEGIVIWQDTNGIVYASSLNGELKQLCSSLAEYLQM